MPPCPLSVSASVAFPLALIFYADDIRLSCRGDCRIDTAPEFPFFVNSISTAHTPSRVVSHCNDFLINPISSGVHPRGDAGGGKRVGYISICDGASHRLNRVLEPGPLLQD